jgi:hypothetical protein
MCGRDGASTVSPRQAVLSSLSPVRLSAAAFAGGVVHQYHSDLVRVLGVCVLLFAQFQLKFQTLKARGLPTSQYDFLLPQ